MFETSKDILNLVLALSVAGISVFVCWLLYYFISSVKKLHDIINTLQQTLESANDLVNNIRNKIKDSSTYLKLIGVLIKKVVQEFKDKRKKTKTKIVKSKKIKKKNKK